MFLRGLAGGALDSSDSEDMVMETNRGGQDACAALLNHFGLDAEGIHQASLRSIVEFVRRYLKRKPGDSMRAEGMMDVLEPSGPWMHDLFLHFAICTSRRIC